MFFSNREEKLRRLKKNLKANLDEVYFQRRNTCLYTLITCYEEIRAYLQGEGLELTVQQARLFKLARFALNITQEETKRTVVRTLEVGFCLNTPPHLQPKPYFSWDCLITPFFESGPVDVEREIQNHCTQVGYYRHLRELADNLKETNDPKKVVSLVLQLRNHKAVAPSVLAEGTAPSPITLSIDNETVIHDFFFGIVGVLSGCGALALGLLFAVPSMCMGSYLGSLQFLLDATAYILTSLAKAVAAAAFPLAMLHSKYTTNSFNIFKSKNARILDSIQELAPSPSEEKEPAAATHTTHALRPA